MQNPGRSRRVALSHLCPGRHRPRSWLADREEAPFLSSLNVATREEAPLQATVIFSLKVAYAL